MGLEPMAQALKVLCATNCATKSYHDYYYFEILTSVIILKVLRNTYNRIGRSDSYKLGILSQV